MKKIFTTKQKTYALVLILAIFCCLSPLFGERAPIDVNLIIDGSAALSDVKEEVTSWVCDRLDQILVDGDKITIWNAGSAARVIYSQTINGRTDIEAAKKSVRELEVSASSTADFSGALREAASVSLQRRQNSIFSYTLLISASPEAHSSALESPQANLLRFSRVEEFPAWRALVVGLNLETRVKRAAASFFGL